MSCSVTVPKGAWATRVHLTDKAMFGHFFFYVTGETSTNNVLCLQVHIVEHV